MRQRKVRFSETRRTCFEVDQEPEIRRDKRGDQGAGAAVAKTEGIARFIAVGDRGGEVFVVGDVGVVLV